MSKSQRSLWVCFSRTDVGLFIYHLFLWSNLNFLHISQWTTLPTQLCQVLYSICANLLHSLIMRLIASSLSPYNLHLLFFLSSLGCNALCMVISFLVLWSICLSSSLVQFKNGPEYLGLLAKNKSLSFFVPLLFSTS